MSAYYELCERYGGGDVGPLKRQLSELIEEDPDFLDPYLMLYSILEDEGNLHEAEAMLNVAYERALELITDEEGRWPDKLEWGWLENRHIIRSILNKAISLWGNGETEEALELFRKLLATNLADNVGARKYILAIRMGMSLEEFEDRFNKGGYYDSEVMEWFDENYERFSDEFDQWEEMVEERE
ncbi:hypothetical protein AKJ38_01520 [candidate division MSBL1 archaeon SCGC-AAA259I14]|uniref:Tetratrico peptide repeat group 5 domain-containing protein n=1 Tax=candidate division MSBL1 archaeon SCGC-AAA259I14 TaxID=1698268 RepID=A0A133UT31_9EURY|nr:hypothetical protein AKJ38_01520 [candidate division MSBL1 archaeon SCGC-AAA259I14]